MVLSLAEHRSADSVRPLTAAEDNCLRLAFGRYGDPQAEDISRATKMLLDLQQEAGGRCWLRCDCAQASNAPVPLMTISGGTVLRPHIRRLEGPGGGRHSLDCDFSTDGDEEDQKQLTYERRPVVDGRRLLRVIPKSLLIPEPNDRAAVGLVKRHNRVSRRKARPPLGRLLAEVMTEAGLQRMSHDETFIEIGEQYRRLREAAERIALAQGVRLRDYFHTHFPSISGFQGRLKNADLSLFSPAPPHGVFLGVADRLEEYTIHIHGGGTLVIPGGVAMYSDNAFETDDGGEDGPFLAAVLFASLNREFAQPVQAFLQPVLSAKRLMLLAAGVERHGLLQIRKLQKGITNSGVLFDIEKPLFSERSSAALAGDADILPTFVARRVSPPPSLLVPIVSAALPSASWPYHVTYKLESEGGEAQEARDAIMRRELRRALIQN